MRHAVAGSPDHFRFAGIKQQTIRREGELQAGVYAIGRDTAGSALSEVRINRPPMLAVSGGSFIRQTPKNQEILSGGI